MPQTVRDRTNRVVSDVLGAPLTAIEDDSSPDTIDGWNSLAHLNLVLALEAEFEVTFSDEDATDMLSVRLIQMILADHGVRDSG